MDAWLEVGELLVSSDLPAALESLKKAYERMVKAAGKEGVPWQLVNNIGALHHERGAYEEAVQVYKEALGQHGPWAPILHLEDADGGVEGGRGAETALPVEKVTVVFNLALSLERTCCLTQAAALYRLILSQYPSYLDCHLRLAVMALDRRDNATAMTHISAVLQRAPDSVDALLLRSRAEADRDDHAAAKDTLKRIVDLSPEKCTAALVALGNWNLNMSARPTRDTKAEASFLEKAREMFHKALTGSSSNMYAANGVGSVVAERGLFDVAKDIFTSVQEASSAPGATDLPDVWMNLANVHLAKGDYALAVKLYEKTLKRFFASGAVGASGAEGFHLRTLSYMARAQYDADQLAQCRRSLLLAVHVAPNNAALRFNVAVALQKMAVTVLKQDKRTAEQVRKVVSDLKTALRLFSQGSQGGVDKKKANSHLEYCQHVLSSAKQHLEVAEREEQQRKQRAEAERQVAEVEASKKRAEEDKLVEAVEETSKNSCRLFHSLSAASSTASMVPLQDMWKRNERPKAVEDDEEGGEDGRGGGKSRKDREKERRKEKKREKHRDREREREREREGEEDGERRERRKDKKRKKKKKHREGRDRSRSRSRSDRDEGGDRDGRDEREERHEDENPWGSDGERGGGGEGSGDEGGSPRGERKGRGGGGEGEEEDALAAAGLVDEEEEGGDARGDGNDQGVPARKRRRQLADSDEEEAGGGADNEAHEGGSAPDAGEEAPPPPSGTARMQGVWEGACAAGYGSAAAGGDGAGADSDGAASDAASHTTTAHTLCSDCDVTRTARRGSKWGAGGNTMSRHDFLRRLKSRTQHGTGGAAAAISARGNKQERIKCPFSVARQWWHGTDYKRRQVKQVVFFWCDQQQWAEHHFGSSIGAPGCTRLAHALSPFLVGWTGEARVEKKAVEPTGVASR
ncbi:unnamed protein product [Closterium sp. NIES-54]